LNNPEVVIAVQLCRSQRNPEAKKIKTTRTRTEYERTRMRKEIQLAAHQLIQSNPEAKKIKTTRAKTENEKTRM
jgi:hypothetical protein